MDFVYIFSYAPFEHPSRPQKVPWKPWPEVKTVKVTSFHVPFYLHVYILPGVFYMEYLFLMERCLEFIGMLGEFCW